MNWITEEFNYLKFKNLPWIKIFMENKLSEIKAVYKLLTDKNSYEQRWDFANILLVNPETINHFIDKEKIESYEVIPLKGNEIINTFLLNDNNFGERRTRKELLVFSSQDSEELGSIMTKIPWYLRICETNYPGSNRRWMLNQEHWSKGRSSLVENLMDRIISFDRSFGGNNLRDRILADDF